MTHSFIECILCVNENLFLSKEATKICKCIFSKNCYAGGDEWRVVAEKLGLSPKQIRYLEKRTLNPCDAALAFISQRCYISVGELYDLLNECGLPVVADNL